MSRIILKNDFIVFIFIFYYKNFKISPEAYQALTGFWAPNEHDSLFLSVYALNFATLILCFLSPLLKAESILIFSSIFSSARQNCKSRIGSSVSMAEVAKLLYIVVVDDDAENRTGKEKKSFRYTRRVLQTTLQLMGCKARHAFKVSNFPPSFSLFSFSLIQMEYYFGYRESSDHFQEIVLVSSVFPSGGLENCVFS